MIQSTDIIIYPLIFRIIKITVQLKNMSNFFQDENIDPAEEPASTENEKLADQPVKTEAAAFGNEVTNEKDVENGILL